MTDAAVVVAGLGPVGGLLAALLGSRGEWMRGDPGTVTAARPDKFILYRSLRRVV